MYNDYLQQDAFLYEAVTQDNTGSSPHGDGEKKAPTDPLYQRISELFHRFREPKKEGFFSGLLGKEGGLHFSLQDVDLGDLLLLGIIILLIVDGENWELAILLGLVLVLSFLSSDDDV